MGKKPTHFTYYVKNEAGTGEGLPGQGSDKKRGIWTKIGAAWMHKDKKGLDIVLEALPVDGRLALREPLEKEGEEMSG